jgi:transcription antitermination factor NusG
VNVFQPKTDEVSAGLQWYAVHVHTRKEAFIASQLNSQGIECFVPTYKSMRKWSDRMKEVELPLFPSYLFSRFDFQDRRPVVMTPGVLQIVGNSLTAIPVPASEISALQTAVTCALPHQPWPYVEVGEKVRVTYGTLAGLEGILVNFKGHHRVVLSVTLLQRSVALEVNLEWLVPVREHRQVSSRDLVLQPAPAAIAIR